MTNTGELKKLLPAALAAVQAASQTLLSRYSAEARPCDGDMLLKALAANDRAVESDLRDTLLHVRPGSRWIEDEDEGGELPNGEWWIVDPAEGNVNHIHGRAGWGVTATLVQDGVPVLTAIALPIIGETYTAIRGGGAFVNGRALRTSPKVGLGAAMVGTGQARPGEDPQTHARIGRSITEMLGGALLVRMSVPATLELVEVAAGRMDGFWQYSQVRTGLAAGALLVREAGGIVTDTHGRPWTFASQDFLAAAPGVHPDVVARLSNIEQPASHGRPT
jgi:myo-inositol-1(or 4)-monophosphatase